MLFGTGLIVFRETLEAALFVGIVAAATGHLAGRTRWLILGVITGVIGSVALAASMDAITAWADGVGQDLVSVALLSIALALLALHAIQAPSHGREASQKAKRIGSSLGDGTASLFALTGAVALAVLREGAETVLFVGGALSGSGVASGELMLSVTSGLALGAMAGALLYRGLGQISPRRLFTITSGLILLIAGGLASQLARTLNQANWLTLLGDKAWDLTDWLPNDSPLGILLHGLIGYEASPSEMQLLSYLAAVFLIALAARYAPAGLKPLSPSGIPFQASSPV
ncbi:MAG: iron permease [Betaproteobacteria bacterium]|nr:iron permease [Betaproteobacteria bacterium]